MGVTRKYIHDCIYVRAARKVLSNLRFSRGVPVRSRRFFGWNGTDGRWMCVWEEISNTHIYGRELRRACYIFRKGEKEERKRGRGWTPYKWDGEALQILSSVNSYNPHSFRSLILSRVWHDEFAGRRMPRCRRVIVPEFISTACLTLHDTNVNTASYYVT